MDKLPLPFANIRKLRKRDTGEFKGPLHYDHLLNAYHDTGIFIFAIEAFLYCRSERYEIPEELEGIIEKHFRGVSDAGTDAEAKEALGFNKGSQVRAANNYWNDQDKFGLLKDLEAMGLKNLNKRLEILAKSCNTDFDSIKTWYYRKKDQHIPI